MLTFSGILQAHSVPPGQFVRDFMDSYRNAPLVPPPLVTGRDLVHLGLSPGPDFGKWLSRLQELQLEGTLRTREEALLLSLIHI